MDTMTLTKATAALCGALLVFLLGKWAAEVLFHMDGHGEAAYVIETESGDAGGEAEAEQASLAEMLAAADVDKGSKVFKKCAACHKLEKDVNATGPSLYGVVGRPVASAAGFGYSGAMTEKGGEWTPEAMDEFLTKPSAVVSGTSMSFAGLKKPADRVNLIAFLNTQSDAPMTFEAAAAGEAATEEPAATETATATQAPAATEEPAATEAPAAEPAQTQTQEPAAEATAAVAGDTAAGEKVFKKCKACHSVEDGANKTGPHLFAVVGRDIGGVAEFKYSSSMMDMGGTWTAENLDAYLTKPKEFIPGTKMSFVGLKKPEDRQNIIAYLGTLGN